MSFGIGLSFVKKILNIHNADLEIESTVGEGTSFIIYMPILKES